MIREAVILAAGLGSRLGDLALGKPKGFVEVGGESLIERSINKLLGVGIERIVIGTGHRAEAYEALANRYPQIVCIRNDEFASTGSMRTLVGVASKVREDFLLLESDILYARCGLAALISADHENLVLASSATSSGDEVFIETDEHGRLVNMSKNTAALNAIHAEMVGITRLSRAALDRLCEIAVGRFAEQPRMDYESCLVAAVQQVDIRVLRIEGYPWCEVDTAGHLHRAKSHVLPQVLESEHRDTPCPQDSTDARTGDHH